MGSPRCPRAVCYDTDRDAAMQRAYEQFRWFGLGSKVNTDLPGPSSFEDATQFVTPDQVAEQIACRPDIEEHVAKVEPYLEAGFTEVALVQIGAEQQEPFIRWAERELLPALRAFSATSRP
jgi:hypothetical protein